MQTADFDVKSHILKVPKIPLHYQYSFTQKSNVIQTKTN